MFLSCLSLFIVFKVIDFKGEKTAKKEKIETKKEKNENQKKRK